MVEERYGCGLQPAYRLIGQNENRSSIKKLGLLTVIIPKNDFFVEKLRCFGKGPLLAFSIIRLNKIGSFSKSFHTPGLGPCFAGLFTHCNSMLKLNHVDVTCLMFARTRRLQILLS